MKQEYIDSLKKWGWYVVCESPLELEIYEGEDNKTPCIGTATGQGAQEIINYCLLLDKTNAPHD